VVAVIAAAALVAGCGTASTGGSGTASTTATTGGAGEFNPNLVPGAGSAPGKTFAKTTKSATKTAVKKSGHKSSGTKVASAGTVIGPSAPAATRTVTQTHTITVSHTVTRTVVRTRYVRPHVPAGAGLPSTKQALSVSHFDADHGNVGCAISGGTVRCDVGRRVWSAGRRPKSCHSAWGQGIYVASSGGAHFVCAGNSVLDPTGYYIHDGYDDKVGSVTCQVRSFGVTCFESSGAGFFIGRTGYRMF
jgi:hypothetical protein